MKVIKSKRSKNTMSLEIEASQETLKAAMEHVFKDLVKSAKVPGFRKGKVTRPIFEKYYGKEMIIKDGVSEAVNTAYVKAIQELKLDVVDYPKNLNIGEYKDNEPLKFSCEVDVKPEVSVDKYKGVKVEKEPLIIDDSLVQAQLDQLKNSSAEYKPVDRAVEKEDLLKVDVKATIDGEPFSRWTKNNVGVGVGSSIFSEQFDENLIGKKKDDVHSFTVTYKEDHYIKEVAGKEVAFEVKVNDVQGREAAELTDELAQKVSQFKTVKELTENIRESLEKQRQKELDETLKKDILEVIISKNSFDIPEGMIKQEIEMDRRYFDNTLKQSGLNLEQYLQMSNQTSEDFEKQLSKTCEDRVRSQLILDGIAKKEKFEASDDDVIAEIKKLKPEADTDEKVQEELKKVNRSGLENMIVQNKVFDFLIEHAKIKEKKAAKAS